MKKLRVTVDGKSYDVEVEILEDDDDGGAAYNFPTASPSTVAPASVPSAPPAPKKTTTSSGDQKTLTSPIAGTVVEVKTSVGAEVKINEPLLVIEAMKMNTNISSPVSAKVKEIKVKSSDAVQQGQILLTFE